VRDGRSVRGLACLTFDDGYGGFFRHALPVLRAHAVPSSVFLVPDAHRSREAFWWDHPEIVRRASRGNRRRWLVEAGGKAQRILEKEGLAPARQLSGDVLPASLDVIRASLGPDLTIGGHTCSHPSLPAVDDAALVWETRQCIADLHEQLGTAPTCLAYPYGAWDGRVRAACAAAGYAACFTLDTGRITSSSDSLALPRLNIPGGIPDAAFEAWVSALHPWWH
jgi:peptidoglycan/xylan/chitin deacetylase (PgdA/CDA1 family)